MQLLPLHVYPTLTVVPDAEERQLLPSPPYQPNEIDIVCERGHAFGKHPGNKKFAEATRSNLQRYVEAQTRIDKTGVVAQVAYSLKQDGARFVKFDNKSKRYHEISEDQAHDKTGHAIRDLMLKFRVQSEKRSKMVVASRTYSLGVVGLSKESDPDSTTVMMGRGHGGGPLMGSHARSRNSFLVGSPAAW
jgi:hypothetical protein